MKDIDHDELIRRFVSIEFNQFLSYYEDADDLNGDDSRERKRSTDESFTRFYINLGKMDKINPAKLMGIINDNLNKNDVEIGQIEILKSFSFFEIDKAYTDEILKVFRNAEYGGRAMIVEVTTKPKQRSRSRSKKRFGSGERRGGSGYSGGGDSRQRRSSSGYGDNKKDGRFGNSKNSGRRSRR